MTRQRWEPGKDPGAAARRVARPAGATLTRLRKLRPDWEALFVCNSWRPVHRGVCLDHLVFESLEETREWLLEIDKTRARASRTGGRSLGSGASPLEGGIG